MSIKETLQFHNHQTHYQTTRDNFQIRLLMKEIFDMVKEREEGWKATTDRINSMHDEMFKASAESSK